MKALRKALHIPWVACALISLLVLAVVLGVRASGWLQRPELIAYDAFIKLDARPASTDDRIAIVGMTEDDLVRYGFPLDDAMLARVLEGVAAQQPAVIGLDMYRDLPEPRNGSLFPQLESALKKLERVVGIERVGFVKASPALAETERVAANNLIKDYGVDGLYRRGPLLVESGVPEPEESLSLAVARRYLTEHGVEAELVPGPDGAPLLKLGKTVFPRLTPNAGGYVGLKVRDYEYLVDFKAPRRFRVEDKYGQYGTNTPYDYSFGDVIEGRLPAGALAGKIVVMATVMQSIKDSNPTPIDDNFRGVQQHVMMTNQLLRGALDGEAPTTWWPDWAETLWIAAATLLGGAIGLRFRSPWKLALALALLVGAIGLAGWQMYAHGVWILVAAPALGCAVAATFVTSFTAYLESSERGAMQSLFSKHVSRKVADELWANREAFLDGGRMQAKRITATVLFTDLKGFSTTSEKMDPATLMDWMNHYFDAVGSHVEANGGMVNKFIGDAIMAVFGAPIPSEDEAGKDHDAASAVKCALAMEQTLIGLNEGWRRDGLPTTEMRVGIYTGPLVAGSLGTSERMEFTVLGDIVNTAARLESAGKEAVGPDMPVSPCTILIGDSTFERLRGKYRTIALGAMSLKGKADKIIVHRVIASAS